MTTGDRRRPITLLAVLCLVSLILSTLDYRQGDEGAIAAVQDRTVAVFAPLQRGFYGVVSPVTGFFSGVVQLTTLREENEQLRAEVEQLSEQRMSTQDVIRENTELRELVGMRDRMEYEQTVAGRVIATQPGPTRWTVLIDVGSTDGVMRNMAVVNGDGLVGKITQVTNNYARVQLATGPDAGYGVRVAETGQHGLLDGRGNQPMDMLLLDDPDDDEVPMASQVVTRAYQGTAIPDGIPVGTVITDPDTAEPGTQAVQVDSHVDFGRLDTLMVILDAPVIPVDDPEESEDVDEPIDETPESPEDVEAAEDVEAVPPEEGG